MAAMPLAVAAALTCLADGASADPTSRVSTRIPVTAAGNVAPILDCSTAGIGSVALQSDLPTLATSNPSNDVSAAITSVSTGTTGGVPYCLVKVLVKPAINIWVGLPMSGQWNGRLQSEGGGGYAGSVGVATGSIAAGYIGVQTDTGHTGGSGSFGMLTPVPNGAPDVQLQTDFAYRSEHLMSVLGKQLAQYYYGRQPDYAYWNGCSTGGRQGIRIAQQFPNDYNGYLVGAPAFHWDRFQAAQIWPQVVMQMEMGAVISGAKQALATSKAVAACDAMDGVVDGLLGDPRQCTYDPTTDATLVQATCTTTDGTCLSPGEARSMKRIWEGPTSTSGKLLWPGMVRGSDTTNYAGTNPFAIAVSQPQYWVYFDPAWNWKTLTYGNYEAFFKKTMQMVGPLMASESPDLSAVRNAGSKIVMWQGWSDNFIVPQGSVMYYDAVNNYMSGGDYSETQKFFRHFMAPGVGHCGGGTGPAPVNQFQAVVDWVERGTAPATITASRALTGGGTRTRPLCPYPSHAVYNGTGSTDVAANFSCSQ